MLHCLLALIFVSNIVLLQFESVYSSVNKHFPVNCDKIKCPPVDLCLEPAQQVKERSQFGGCCPGCVYIVGFNESCNSTTVHCQAGLTCDPELGKCIKLNESEVTECINRRERFQHLHGKKVCLPSSGVTQFTGFHFDIESIEPDCDLITGLFRAKQCQSAKCHCVDPQTGDQIFGKTQMTSSSNMTCACSLALTNITSNEDDYLIYQSTTHLHCQSDGNFAKLQCYQDLCYCADPATGQPVSDVVNKNAVSVLDCFYDTYQRLVKVNCDEKVEYTDEDGKSRLKNMCYCVDQISGKRWKMHNANQKLCFDFIESQNLITADYSKTCETSILSTSNLTRYFARKGVSVIGLNSIQCDLDGDYAARQCTDSECQCVNSQGGLIKNYRIDRYGNDDRLMKCDCARQEYEIENLGRSYDKLLCNLYGNFKPDQSFESGMRCFCVDDDGNRISDVISSNNILSSLSLSSICTGMREILYADSSYEGKC